MNNRVRSDHHTVAAKYLYMRRELKLNDGEKVKNLHAEGTLIYFNSSVSPRGYLLTHPRRKNSLRWEWCAPSLCGPSFKYKFLKGQIFFRQRRAAHIPPSNDSHFCKQRKPGPFDSMAWFSSALVSTIKIKLLCHQGSIRMSIPTHSEKHHTATWWFNSKFTHAFT